MPTGKPAGLFLRKPLAVVPETAMTYDGVPDARDRGDLIAYLRQGQTIEFLTSHAGLKQPHTQLLDFGEVYGKHLVAKVQRRQSCPSHAF